MNDHPSDQLLIDRVVRAIDALLADADPGVTDSERVTLLPVRRDGHTAVRPGRRWTLAAAAALVVGAAAGAIVLGGRGSDTPRPATVPSTATSGTVASSAPAAIEPATGGGIDPRTTDPESVLPYVLDLPDAMRGAVSGYSNPFTGGTGATLLADDGRLISIEAIPPDSAQPLPRVDGEPVEVPSGDAVWTDAPTGGRLLNWWTDEAQYAAWGAGVSEQAVLAAVIEWDASGRAADGFVLDAVWSVDELIYGATYTLDDHSVNLQLSRWPDVATAGNPAARPTSVDGRVGWRTVDGPAGVSWRLDDGSWMSLTGSDLTDDQVDGLLDRLRPHEVPAPTSAGTIEVDLGDRMLTYPVVVGRQREVFREQAVLLDGSAPLGEPSTGTQIVVLPPDLTTWLHTPLEGARDPADRIRWTLPDGRVLEYVVGDVGGAFAGFNGPDDLQLTTVAGGSLSGRYLVGGLRVTPLGDESALHVVDADPTPRAVTLEAPEGATTYEVAGRTFTVERGTLPIPSIAPTDGVCVRLDAVLCQPWYPDGWPQLIGDQTANLGPLRVWVNVPEGVDMVRIVDGGSETWQVPVDGVAAWLAPVSEDWEVTAIDIDRPFFQFLDAEAVTSGRAEFEQDHPLDIPDSATDPHADELGDVAAAAGDRVLACVADATLASTSDGAPGSASSGGAGVSKATWDRCVGEGQAWYAGQAAAITADAPPTTDPPSSADPSSSAATA